MKKIVFFTGLLCTCFIVFSVQAKNYTRKAARPAVSDHTWYGYDYNFNIDESGRLTGTNTFSKVYNTTPPRWYNDGYALVNPKITLTGSESLTITVNPGDFNYTYTLKTAVTKWQWDTHLLKWVKVGEMPYNGTRTFKVRDGIVDGNFEFPVVAGILYQRFIFGNSENGLIPANGMIGWKVFDGSDIIVANEKIIPEGNSTRLNIETYKQDVLKTELWGEMGSDENGTFVKMQFPIFGDDHDIVGTCLSLAGAGSWRDAECYTNILLPDVYYDKYVSPYDPVTTMLPNGHKVVTTLNPDGYKDIVESWQEKGFDYVKETIHGVEKPVLGTKMENGKKYIHMIKGDGWNRVEELGYYEGNQYYMIKKGNISIDWSPAKSEGHYVITDSKGNRYYAYTTDIHPENRFNLFTVQSDYTEKIFGGNRIFQMIGANGEITVTASNETEMSEAAKDFIQLSKNPYILHKFNYLYKDKINLKYFKEFNPPHIKLVSFEPAGKVTGFTLASDIPNSITESYHKYAIEQNNQLWEKYLSGLCNKNPLEEVASLIHMELDIQDYDVSKINAKIVGKRTAALLKQLCSLLTQKAAAGYSWPNKVTRIYTHENKYYGYYKKAVVKRISKEGAKVTIRIMVMDDKDCSKETVFTLENNIPMDEYAPMWEELAKVTK